MSSNSSKKIITKQIQDNDSDNEILKVDSDHESENQESDNENISDDEVQDQDETDDEANNKNTKKGKKEINDKKQKESFDVVSKRMEKCLSNIKLLDKEISDLEKSLKIKEKDHQEQYKQLNILSKLLVKSHTEELSKVQKIKTKRVGNANGGFNKEHPVPEILRKFLELPEDIMLSRPQVMSKLNNKFTSLGLKQGQITTIDQPTLRALKLGKEWAGKEIKFGEFQTFLATFYPKAN
jgi:hypothetical protein